MKKFSQTCQWVAFQHKSDLPENEQVLLQRAHEARSRAYAPYSRFSVGAALILEDGTIIEGNNQENAAYPSGLCAERVAIFWTGANHPGKKIIAMAITASSDLFASDKPIAPCGACRQAMLEYELNQKEPIQLIMQGGDGDIIKMDGVKNLLPIYFHEDGLKK